MVLWFFDTPAIGSVVVFAVGISVFLVYYSMLRWIQSTPPDRQPSDETAAPDTGK
jgi:hypothetical protein